MDVNASRRRWDEMLRSLAGLLPPGPASVLVGGRGEQAAVLAARLAAALEGRVRVCSDGGAGGAPWDVVIWARTATAATAATAGHGGEDQADIVIDMHDPDWPVIRRVAAPLAARGPWYLTETRAFFGCRAATWDAKFGDDLPAYAAAIAQAGIAAGGVVIDLGCGTGRALPSLRQAVGPDGSVIAVDVTPEMLSQARPASRRARAALVLADAQD